MRGIQADRLSYSQLRSSTQEFLAKYHPDDSLPVPIEDIIDVQMGIDIVPMANFENTHNITGALSADFQSIYVDMDCYMNPKYSNRYRITLAHELAHLILHDSKLAQLKTDNLAEWYQIADLVDDKTNDWLEWQAFSWAGLLLVPSNHLYIAFEKEREVAKKAGFEEEDQPQLLVDYISESLTKLFQVSSDVISRRVRYDKLSY